MIADAGLFCLAFLASGLYGQPPPVRVQVLDLHGAPVRGAEVVCGSARAGSDEAGVALPDCRPPCEIRASAAGFEPESRRVTGSLAGPVVFHLRPATLRTTLDVVVRETPVIGPVAGSRREIDRRGARTVFDAVEKLAPGAFVTRRGVMGYGIAANGTGVVTLRGIGGQPNTGVLVVIDGRPDFQGLMGHPLPDFYSLSDAGTVTVIEGPASVLYGSNAMGGVIEISSARPPERMETRLSSSLGSYLTGQHRLSNGARLGRAFYSLAGGISHTRGERAGAAFRSQDGSLSAGYDLTPSWKASVQARAGHFHVEDPGPAFAPLAASYARVGRGGGSFNLENATSRTWGYLRAHSSHGHHILSDGFRSVDRSTGLRVHQHLLLGARLMAEAGADAVNYGGGARNVPGHTDYGAHTLTAAAGFARAHWTPAERVRLNAGVRYEDHSQLGAVAAPEFGLAYSPTSRYSLAASAGRGFRNPTIRELYLFPAPNPALGRESLWNYELAFQARARADLDGSLSAYYAGADNLIVTTGRFPNLCLLNSGRALNRGLEANWRWRPARRLRIGSGFARLWSTNLGPYVPRTKWNYSLDLELKRAFVNFGGMAVGSTWVDLRRERELGGYHVATVKCTLPVHARHTLFVLIDNLFDKRYQVIDGYPMPGINAAGGFSLRF